MLREFQEEIARLKAELASRQAGKSTVPPAAAPEASGLVVHFCWLHWTLAIYQRVWHQQTRIVVSHSLIQAQLLSSAVLHAQLQMVPQDAQDTGTKLAVVRDAMREDILRQLQQAASLEALQKARQAAERAAQQRLEAELAGGL